MPKKVYTEEDKLKKKLYYEANKYKTREKTEEEKLKKKEYDKKWFEENKDKSSEYNKKQYQKNKEVILSKILTQEQKENRKIYIRDYKKNRMQTNILYNLHQNMSSLIRQSLKYNNCKKNTKTINILGCSIEHFKDHLQNQFSDWMNWKNKGNQKNSLYKIHITWDIDHILPLSIAINKEELLKLSHYTNLRPLCSYYNRYIKKDNVLDEYKNLYENFIKQREEIKTMIES
jgi:hypothetical protein